MLRSALTIVALVVLATLAHAQVPAAFLKWASPQVTPRPYFVSVKASGTNNPGPVGISSVIEAISKFTQSSAY